MEFKGTKEKWELLSDENWCEIQTKLPLKSICAVNRNLEEYKANALLISKAPEMLDMLKEVKSRLKGNGFPSLTAMVEQLIKEATEI